MRKIVHGHNCAQSASESFENAKGRMAGSYSHTHIMFRTPVAL